MFMFGSCSDMLDFYFRELKKKKKILRVKNVNTQKKTTCEVVKLRVQHVNMPICRLNFILFLCKSLSIC